MKSLVLTSTKWMAVLSLSAGLLAGCGSTSTDKKDNSAITSPAPTAAASATPSAAPAAATPADAYKVITDEMDKAGTGKPDYALVQKTYSDKLKGLVQKRDSEASENTDQLISAAIEGATSGQMNGKVAKQLVDKLLQKVLYTSMKAALKDANTNWAKPEEAKKNLESAKQFYKPVLESTVKKRDDAFKTTMSDAINGAFADAEKAVGSATTLKLDLARQVIDKTLIKTFYLATAGKDLGYAYKIEKGAKEGTDVKVEQAEAWAFFQSFNKYVAGIAKEEVDFVNKQFDLGTDPKTINSDTVNKTLVRALAKVGSHEYVESQDAWGTDKSIITGLEGAVFIDMISSDITRLQGETAYKTLYALAQQYIKLAQDNKKDEAVAVMKQIQASLDEVIAKAK
jgi:hypothetical protein